MARQDLLNLPAELLNNALSYLEADDVIAFSRTCSRAHKFVTPDNSTLWRQVFLNSYDNPDRRWSAELPTARKANQDVVDNWDWFFRLRQRMTVVRLITAEKLINVTADYTEVVQILLNMIETAKTRPSPADIARGIEPQIDDRRSLNIDVLTELSDRRHNNLDRIIHARQMDLLAHIPSRNSTNRPVTRSTLHLIEQPDIAARLHVLHGLTKMEKDAPRLRGIARRLVYDWSLTGPTTDFGPFKLNGSGEVNWQLLEGVCSTISRNFSRCADGRYVLVLSSSTFASSFVSCSHLLSYLMLLSVIHALPHASRGISL